MLHDAFIVGVIVQPSGHRPRPGNARINPLGDGGMLFLAQVRASSSLTLLQDQPQSGTGRSRDGNGYHHG
jgi:hypothetical protein